MREIKAGAFKARCLALLDEVAESGESIVITKRGKPVAQLTPVVVRPRKLFGCMKGSVGILDESLGLAHDGSDERDEAERLDRIAAALRDWT